MNIEPLGFLAPATPLPTLNPFHGPGPGGSAASAAPAGLQAPGDFASWFTRQLAQVNADLAQSDQQLQALAAGEAQNLHQVMISLEEARLSFQLLAQVRNRALEAYQDVMRMQL